MAFIAATVEAIVNGPREQVFPTIASIDLSSIFTGFGPLPAVTGVTDQVGGWDSAGQTRSVMLSDGSSASESLTEYRHPAYFSYTLGGFTNVLRFLTTSANGEWWFESISEAKTHIRWRYAFKPRSVVTVPLLWFVANALWRGYMNKALALSKRQVESTVAQQACAPDRLSAPLHNGG